LKAAIGFFLFILLVILSGCKDNTLQPTPAAANVNAETNISESILDSQSVDLDGDDKKELLKLVYSTQLSKLLLVVGSQSVEVTGELPGINDTSTNNQQYIQKPSITLLQTENREPAILVSIVWGTNKIGSTVDMWVFDYKDQQLKRIWDVQDAKQTGEASFDSQFNTVNVTLPAYNLEATVTLDGNQKKLIGGIVGNNPNTAKHEAILSDLTAYQVTKGSDGRSVIRIQGLVAFDSAPFYLSPITIDFQIKGDKVVLIHAILQANNELGIAIDQDLKKIPSTNATPEPAKDFTFSKIIKKVNVVNEWKGTCFNRPCIFYAGVMQDDPIQGVLIQQYADDSGISLYPTPRKHGALRIVKEDSMQFSLLSEDGTSYGFDNSLGKYVQSSEKFPLSFKPGIFFPDSDLKALKSHEVELKTAMNVVHALSERNLTLFKEQFINLEAAQQAGYTINDPSIVYAFHHIEYWGNVEARGERCIVVHAHAGDQVNGKEDERTMAVCMQQNDQKQWKVYMID
jgi:hypothetical protein